MRDADAPVIARIQLAIVGSIGRARRALRRPALDDEAIHGARKELKRARSGLRLLRPLDEAAYVRENGRLRDIARRLSDVRDNKVLLERTARLLDKVRKPSRRQPLLALRKELRNARRRCWRALRSAERTHQIDDSLATVARHVRAWRTPAQAEAGPALAMRRLHRKGRKALARSHEEGSDERLHEARKQAKHIAQALEILSGDKLSKKAKKVLSRAEDMGDWLGDDHDLAVVEGRLMTVPGSAAKAKKRLRSLLDKRRERLQKKAFKAGDKLFRKKTKRVLLRAARTTFSQDRRSA